MALVVLATAAFVVSTVLTGWIRVYTIRRGLLDVPNHRSSHDVPTPRGGGVVFAILFLAALLAFIFLWPDSRNLWVALFGGGCLVALIGWIDDRANLSVALRLLVHGLAAAWSLAWVGGLHAVNLGVVSLPLGYVGVVLAWLGIIWAINLYNFMDGIDGIAAGEAVMVSLTAGALFLLSNDWQSATAAILLAGLVAGFLVWNWSPAKIFMGDVGSGFLGYTLAVLALVGENRGTLPLVVWVILLAVFLVDATSTLLWRIGKGEKWYTAHRSHAYQRLVQAGYSHRQVTLGVLMLNVGLSIFAYVSYHLVLLRLPLTVLIVLGLLLLWWRIVRHYPIMEEVTRKENRVPISQ